MKNISYDIFCINPLHITGEKNKFVLQNNFLGTM